MSDKPTLYLVPGLLCDERVWAHQQAVLGADWDVRIANTRGCCDFADMAQRILDDAPARFALAGHSMGARVALVVMQLTPERVTRLALMDTGVHPRGSAEFDARMRFVTIAREQGMAALARAWGPPMVGTTRRADERFMDDIFEMVQRYSLDEYEGQINALLNRPDAEQVLKTVTCPTLVLCGRDDEWSPPSQHEPIVAALQRPHYVIIEDCGHMAPMEQPEPVTEALRNWLSDSAAKRSLA